MPNRLPGERVRDRRKALGMTQVQLAHGAGIGQAALSAIETGATVLLRGATLLGLAKALGVEPEWIQAGLTTVRPHIPDSAFRELLAKLDPRHRQTLLEIGRSLLAQQEGRATSNDTPEPARSLVLKAVTPAPPLEAPDRKAKAKPSPPKRVSKGHH